MSAGWHAAMTVSTCIEAEDVSARGAVVVATGCLADAYDIIIWKVPTRTLHLCSRAVHVVVGVIVVIIVTLVALTAPIVSGAVPGVRAAGDAPTGLHVVGQQLLDGSNHPLILRGVNRSGTEYACIQGWGFFDGPSDLTSVQAIAAWGANAVRIPLNEDCWLNINGAPPAYAGASYQNAITAYVSTVQAAGLVPILDLHWTGAGTGMATGQQPMLNRDHSGVFWQQVADAYKNNTGVVFDLHNEPYPDNNRDTAAAWDCWKNGTTTANAAACPGSGLTYQAAGMQETLNTVRATGANNAILLGGVQYSNALSGWLTYKPQDPAGNLLAATHVYNFNVCSSPACYDATLAPVAAQVPLVAGEIGESDCGTGMLTTLMNWLDAHNSGYLAWTWDTWGTACANLALITDYAGSPTAYGQAYRDHLLSVIATPTVTPTGTPAVANTATATPTPGTVLVGHVTWQGPPSQPSTGQRLPLTLTLCVGSTPVTYGATTDSFGFFTVTASLPSGSYNWQAKGPKYLATGGTLSVTSGTTQMEMGTERAGDLDATHNNVVNIIDFNVLKGVFGQANSIGDLNNDGVTNVTDFNLLKGNFGQAGAAANCP